MPLSHHFETQPMSGEGNMDWLFVFVLFRSRRQFGCSMVLQRWNVKRPRVVFLEYKSATNTICMTHQLLSAIHSITALPDIVLARGRDGGEAGE